MKEIIKQYAHDFRGMSLTQFELEDIFARFLIECFESEETKYSKTLEDYNKDVQLNRLDKVNFLISLKGGLTNLLSPVSDTSECFLCNYDIEYKHIGKEERIRTMEIHRKSH